MNQVSFVNRAIQQVPEDVRAGVQKELLAIAAPIRDEASTRALGQGYGMDWSRLRVGQNVRSVYVVPVLKGTKIKSKKRPNFSRLMLATSMRPALAHHAPETERRITRVVNRVVAAFNRK